ncbi:Rrf2 family transcriptional regulator [Isoalcanivorax pacificus]|uniref:Rrf2 family transcriptional regulator n=1 Tax=Isoalcanivorax pacificus TaxID=1306787 RepID=UPI0002E7DC00|nr:Rrf2 family transcriptional regulator [Isoalcanivorax pacificus]
MNRDSKLSSVLHVLLHMAHHDAPMTSDQLAACLHTNAVVIRRTLAGLREQGYVCSVKGHGGGWQLCCELSKVSLLDIYRAVGAPPVFAMGHRTTNPACLVEQTVNGALDDAFNDAEALLVKRLGSVTLAELAADFSRRLDQCSRRSSR